MALNKPVLKGNIKQLLADMRTTDENADDEYATRLSDAIEEYITGGTIIYQSGLFAPNGAVTGMFNGYIE